MPGGFGFEALCMTTGLSRSGDRLDPLTYCVGSGLSWKPIAAAFRFSTFNTLAFTLASYSSIELRDILLAVLEHPVDQTRQLVPSGRLELLRVHRSDCGCGGRSPAHRRHGPAQRLRHTSAAQWSLGWCPCDGRGVSSSGCSHPAADTAAANWRSVSRWESD